MKTRNRNEKNEEIINTKNGELNENENVKK